MDLKSGLPFSLIKDGLVNTYPKLEKNITADVVVLGGGISGALSAFHLADKNISSVVVDARSIGLGSTCASTSLLQYEIDIPLHKLVALIGEKKAVRSYHLCKEAIDKLFAIATKIGFTGIAKRESLYYAAAKKDLALLANEFAARKKYGFNVQWVAEKNMESKCGFPAPGAIVSATGAQTNAYLFTHALHQYNIRKGVQVFDRSPVTSIRHTKKNVQLVTENGCKITTRKLVYATGYESLQYIKEKIVTLQSTYAIVSESLNNKFPFWKKDRIIWNTAKPYLYLRTTDDRRVLVGGRDEPFYSPAHRDALLKRKTKQLVADFNKLFPAIAFKPEFSWTGTFGSTKDGLPYIGEYPKLANSYFALGFGGNGITFSVIAAELISQLIKGKTARGLQLFAFNRK